MRWVTKKGRSWHLFVKDFGNDLSGAVEMYSRVKATGRHNVTLRCKNSGFPPPEELRPYWHKKKVIEYVKKRGRLRKVVRYKDVYRVPMRRLNRKEGKWWCPYCRELREFVKSYELPFQAPPNPIVGDIMPKEPGMYCPMCFVGTSDHNVRKWNPLSERF